MTIINTLKKPPVDDLEYINKEDKKENKKEESVYFDRIGSDNDTDSDTDYDDIDDDDEITPNEWRDAGVHAPEDISRL